MKKLQRNELKKITGGVTAPPEDGDGTPCTQSSDCGYRGVKCGDTTYLVPGICNANNQCRYAAAC